MSRDDAYLVDMLIAARDIQTFKNGVALRAFLADRVLQAAVQHWIQTIGEAARSVSPVTRDAHPAIPWRSTVGMRNRLVHAYWDVRPSIVWDVVQRDIPALIDALESIVPPDSAEA